VEDAVRSGGSARLRVGALVLAGGTARRIGGGDKTALDLGGRTILDRLLAALTPMPTVVLADDPTDRLRAAHPHARWRREDPPRGGPAAALAAGLVHLTHDTPVDVVVVLAGDQPYAGAAVPRLLDALAEHPATRAAVALDPEGRPQHLLGAYRVDPLRTALAGVRPGDSLRPVRTIAPTVLVAAGAAETLDVDTPEDLAAARRLVD
jgi:molybdopterin-guanine dinucleotide biosynthesis protein A